MWSGREGLLVGEGLKGRKLSWNSSGPGEVATLLGPQFPTWKMEPDTPLAPGP